VERYKIIVVGTPVDGPLGVGPGKVQHAQHDSSVTITVSSCSAHGISIFASAIELLAPRLPVRTGPVSSTLAVHSNAVSSLIELVAYTHILRLRKLTDSLQRLSVRLATERASAHIDH
jgi:hypothetical protein